MRRLRTHRTIGLWLVLLPTVVSAQAGSGETAPVEATPVAVAAPAETIIAAVDDAALRDLLYEVAQRNPAIASAEARARAAARKAPAEKGLPDPMVNLIAYLEPPQTRTGPQRYVASVTQALPWGGRLKSGERAALYGAEASTAEAEALRLRLVTEARALYLEIGYLDRYRQITEEFRGHLLKHEELARSRYSTGVGLGQEIIKIQAEITGVDGDLLDVASRRVALVARLNSLRDRPSDTPIQTADATTLSEVLIDKQALHVEALQNRPEIAAATARVARAEALSERAKKEDRPGFVVGLTYAGVDRRDDMAGKLQPPEGNGDDIFGIQGGISIPLWRDKLGAGVESALEEETAASASRHDEIVRIDAVIGDLAQRLPLSWRRLRLIEDVLIVQAEEAVESARAGYMAGTLNALDLLDAEHVLFEAHTAVARAQTDYLVALTKLEGAVGAPLPVVEAPEGARS